MPSTKSKLIVRAKKWSKENGLHGKMAFQRYIMFLYVEALDEL